MAKGYKIARVDQMETALGKDMRERDEKKSKKEEKVIRRELASVLTSGTLVDGGMLQDDMATYCAAIKETEVDGKPAFGIAFVDTATAQFHLAEFVDDADMTRFETFVAQTRPGELLLEKGCISMKALRMLKNNTPPTTIWNYLKPDKGVPHCRQDTHEDRRRRLLRQVRRRLGRHLAKRPSRSQRQRTCLLRLRSTYLIPEHPQNRT